MIKQGIGRERLIRECPGYQHLGKEEMGGDRIEQGSGWSWWGFSEASDDPMGRSETGQLFRVILSQGDRPGFFYPQGGQAVAVGCPRKARVTLAKAALLS